MKTKPDQHDTKDCIYQIPCECGASYIEETKRPLEIRVKEHKKNTTSGEIEKSRLAQHAWTEHYQIQWNNAKIIDKEEHWRKRKFKEAVYITNNKKIFSQPSVDVRN